jgi:hypothetical protein
MLKIILATVLLTLTGCAAWTTPSTYSNHNTPNGNVITAQGKAAENAAYSNTSHNCPSCNQGNTQSNSGSGYYDQYGRYQQGQPPPSAEEQFVTDVKYDLYNTMRYTLSRYVNEFLYR